MNGIPLNIDFQQVLLHLINVVILFAILYLLIYKPVKDFMDKRSQEYKNMENEATGKVKEAEDLKASYEEKLRAADDEIRSMRTEASREAEERAEAIEEEARVRANNLLVQARAQAESEKEKIIGSAGDQVAQLAKDAAAKVLFDNPSDAYDQFLKSADDNQ